MGYLGEKKLADEGEQSGVRLAQFNDETTRGLELAAITLARSVGGLVPHTRTAESFALGSFGSSLRTGSIVDPRTLHAGI
jgi:hypothetical protein